MKTETIESQKFKQISEIKDFYVIMFYGPFSTLSFYGLERVTVKLEMRGLPPRPDENGSRNTGSTAPHTPSTGTGKLFLREFYRN